MSDHGSRGWEATDAGWRCTECRQEVVGPIDVAIDDAHVCNPPRPVPEEGPEASYNVCKCGHRESWHNTPYRPNCTGSFGECPCFVFEFDHAWPPATVPAPHAAAEDESSWRKEAYDARQQIADLSAELAAANDERDFWKNNDNERSAKVRKLKAENAALSARLERVREWTDVLDKESYDDRRSISSLAFAMTRAAAGIRAALGEDA